ncbi:MAG: hypothetical protein ACOX7R_09895 [Acetivibrionales bacterium]|jgi:uncharacterized protein with PhoU and TrkA domain
MSILDNIGKKVTETAKTAAKRSGDIVEVTRLNMNIAAEEDKIKRVYNDIGKAVYKDYLLGKEVCESAREFCEKINGMEKSIEQMKEKILELRNIKVCPECGMELQIEMAFCHRCGVKQEVEDQENKPEEENADEEKTVSEEDIV